MIKVIYFLINFCVFNIMYINTYTHVIQTSIHCTSLFPYLLIKHSSRVLNLFSSFPFFSFQNSEFVLNFAVPDSRKRSIRFRLLELCRLRQQCTVDFVDRVCNKRHPSPDCETIIGFKT